MDWRRYGQAEEVQASSEGEIRGVKRTRRDQPAEGKANMEAKAKDLAASI